MQRLTAQLALLLVLMQPLGTYAWDAETGVPGPVLTGVLPEGLRLTSVDVRLVNDSVSITYNGEYQGVRPRATSITSYSRVFGWQGVAADHPDQHMPEMTLRLNGQRLDDRRRASAFLNGTDITGRLVRAGVNPLKVASGEEALVARPSLAAREFYANTSGPTYPLWHLLYRHAWSVPPLPQGELRFELQYLARPAKSEVATDSKHFEGAVRLHCGDVPYIKKQLKSLTDEEPSAVVLETLTIPLQLATLATTHTYLSARQTTPDQNSRAGLMLACGINESSLLIGNGSSAAQVTDGTPLSVLRIWVQR